MAQTVPSARGQGWDDLDRRRQRYFEGLATATTGIYAPRKMQKMSKLILALAEQVLTQPTEKSSREAVAAALLLAHVAWNRAVDPLGGDQVGSYRKILGNLQAVNPRCLRELKGTDCEALVQALTKLKATRYPKDDRIIRLCGLTAENKVHAEWHHRGGEGTN